MGKYSALIWKMGNGEEILIKNMDDSHLENAIRYMEENAQRIQGLAMRDLELVEDYLSGEQALYLVDSHMQEYELCTPMDFIEEHTKYPYLLEERDRRLENPQAKSVDEDFNDEPPIIKD